MALLVVASTSCASATPKAPGSGTNALTTKKPSVKPSTKTTTRKTTTTGKPTKTATTKVTTGSALTADHRIDVRFDTPGAKPRALNETTVSVAKPVSTLSMNVTNITYRGLVCGFSFRGQAPKGPVTIRMQGTSAATSFDSGPLAISWTGLDSDLVKADSGANNGWSFSSEAHVNRNGPGWVISLGGVTAEAPNVVPKTATCELVLTEPLSTANGPIGYWAGFAAV